jgi:hypothetical protein
MNIRNFLKHYAQQAVLLFLALCTAFISFSQGNISVAPTRMNVLYIGVDNPLSVAASNGGDDEVSVSLSGGEGSVSKISTGLYNVRVASVTDNLSVNVFVNKVKAGSSSFRVRNLPVPIPSIGGMSSGSNMTADKFRTQPGVSVHLKDFPFDVKYEVLSFTFTIDDGNDRLLAADCKGALFSSEAKAYIDQYAKAGSIVTLDAIRVKDLGGRELNLPALVYYIK